MRNTSKRITPLDSEDLRSAHLFLPVVSPPHCVQSSMVRYLSGCATDAEAALAVANGRFGNAADWTGVQRGLAACANCGDDEVFQRLKIHKPEDDSLRDYIAAKEDHAN